MLKWKDISLFQFQEFQRLEEDKNLSEIDRVLFQVCVAHNLTPHALDNMNPVKVARMIKSLKLIFGGDIAIKTPTRLQGHRFEYDIGKITLGQYIELEFWLTASDFPILTIHKAIASLCKRGKNGEQIVKAESLQNAKAYLVLGALKKLKEGFAEFNAKFSGLFGLNAETHGDHVSDPFNKRYGWTYAATTVAQHEGIPLQEAYRMNIVHAFSDLGFIKAKADYERKLYKTNTPNGG